jgi:EmrB/QacA subfamily drug resistance transporter
VNKYESPPEPSSLTKTWQCPQTSASDPDWLLVAILLTGTFMVVLDFFIVNVAIPDLQNDLTASPAQIQFVVAGYALACGSALIVGSRLGDIYGRRRTFISGLALFTLSSAACGLAPNASVLVVARGVQGLSAALLSPQILAILSSLYQGTAKARALNAYGFCMGFASVFGQVIGGVLIHLDLFGWGWRSCFLLNFPIGLTAIVLASRILPESAAPRRPQLDLAGMILISLALLATTLPLIEGRQNAWPLWSWLSLAAAIGLFVVFVIHENRLKSLGAFPLIDLGLFSERAFSVGLLAQLIFYMSMAGFYLVFAIYMQEGRALDALQAGTIFVANGLGYLASSSVARQVSERLGRQVLALAGALRALGLGFLLLTIAMLGETGNILWILPGLFLNGLGTGFAVAPLASNVLSRISSQHAGAAAGVLTTGIQVGNALGVAIIGMIFYGAVAASAPPSYAQAFILSLVYLIAASILLAGLAQFLPSGHDAGERK